MYTITQKIYGSVHLKLEHIVVYENSSDEFEIGHCPIKVKVKVKVIFLHLPQYKLSSSLSQLWHMLVSMSVNHIIIYKIIIIVTLE